MQQLCTPSRRSQVLAFFSSRLRCSIQPFLYIVSAVTLLGVGQITCAQVTNPAGYNFGTVNLGSSASTTVTFAFTSSVTVGSVTVVTQGATGQDFQATSPNSGTTLCTAKAYTSGTSCTVAVTFAPLAPGQRLGAAVLRNSTNQVIGTAYVAGAGSGAQLGFTAPSVSTFVGTGVGVLTSPVGLSGTSAGFLIPWRMAFDSASNMYMADQLAETIYKITPAGLVSSVIGQYRVNCGTDGTCGYPTSNSTTLAVNSKTYLPYSVLVDGAGLLWFVDNSNAALATVDLTSGYVTAQIPGNYTGSGAPHTSGNIHNLGISSLGALAAIATDGLGNIYVSCFYDGSQTTSYALIVKLDPAGNISVFAGGTTPYNGQPAPADGATAVGTVVGAPSNMAVDSAGNLYYYDALNLRIYKIDTAGKVHPFAGSGTIATDNTSALPYWQSGVTSTTANTAVNFAKNVGAIAVDSSGNVYVPSAPSSPFDSTSLGSRVFVFTQSGYAYVLAGTTIGEVNGTAASSQLAAPTSVGISPAGDVYIGENNVRRDQNSPAVYIGSSVRKWSMAGSTLNFGSQAKGSTSAGQTVSATNLGNAPMILTTPSTGTNPFASSGFTLLPNTATNSCGTGSSGAVAVYSSCSVIPAFEPNVASGTVAGTLTFTGNVGTATSKVPLTGTAAVGVASLKMTGLPTSSTSGTSNTVTVSAYDSGQALFTGYTGTVSFSLSPTDVASALPSSYTFTGSEGGTKTFSVALSAPGSETVTVADTANGLSANETTTVAAAVDHFAFTVAPPVTTTAGVSFNVTVTAYSNSGTTVATSYAGPIKFTTSDGNAVLPTGTALNMTAGVGTYAIKLESAGTQTLSVADASGSPTTANVSIAVSAGAAYAINAYSGTNQSAIIGTAFTNAFVVQTVDAYSNPVGGVTVAFAAPTTGAGASFSAASCVTSATATPVGSCSVTATANSTAGTYSVTASSGSLTSGTFALTNVAKTAQTITFTQPGAQTFGTTPTLTASSASSLTVAFSSTTTSVCTITSAGALTFLTAGTCSISADQAGNSTYSAATTVSRSFTVNAVVSGAPTIGTATGGNAQASISFTAPVNTGGTSITGYTVTSSPGSFTGTGTASPITVSGLTNGTAYTFTVTATNSAGTSVASAASNSVTPAGTQTITFTNPGTQTYGTTPTLAATASSGLAVTFTSTTTGVCTVTSGGTLTFVTTGTCTINADQAGNGSYPAAPTVPQSFTVQPASQTITFTQPTAQSFGTTPTLSAASTSGLTVTFTSTTTGVCTITTGGVLAFASTGTCSIAANQAGNSNYSAATAVTRSFSVNAVVTSAPTIGTATAGNAQASVSFIAPASTGGTAVTGYSVTSSPGGITGTGTASPITVSGLTNGTAYVFTVTATNSAGTSAASATSNSVTPIGTQTITFTNPGTQTFGTSPTLTATASSGLTVSFTSSTSSVCAVTGGGVLTFAATGTCSINANQAGNSAYAAATTVAQSFSVQLASQTITFAQPTTPVTYGVSPIILSATGGASGNAVTFSVMSGPGTVSGSTLTVTGAGTIVVAADQAGNSNYSAASEVQRSIAVNAASQTITFTQPTTPVTYGTSPITLIATGGGSGNAVTFSVISGPGTVSGSALTVTGAGTIIVAANQTGNTNYSAATEVQRSIVVNTAAQTIIFTQPTTPITYGSTTTVALSATGGASANAVTFTIASGPGTISGSTLTITGAGTIVVNANQAASVNYAAATQVQRSITVSTAASTLSGPAAQPVFVVYSQTGIVPVTIAGQYTGAGITAPSGTIAYSIVNASNTSVASGSLTISGTAVSVPVASSLAPGLYTVNASYTGDTNYSAATSITINLQVGQIQPIVAITSPVSALTYGSALGIVATSTYNSIAVPGTFTYRATPTGGTAASVTAASVLPAGSYVLTANFTPTDAVTYKTATATASLTINKTTPSVLLTSSVNPLLVQNATTLTVTVSSAVSTPTGTVTFYDNTASAPIGAAVPLTNGVATMSVSTLTVGTHSITAIYSGDTNFLTLTSTAVSELVEDFSLAISTSTGSSTSQTILPGGTATYSFTLSPTGAVTFPAPVTLTVTGLPTGATYTITPSSLAAGSGSTPVTLTVTAPKQTAMLHNGEKFAPFALALLLLPFGGRLRRRASKLSRLAAVLLLLVGGAVSIASLTGCGSTTGFFASPQQTYNVTITGTSGALTHSTTVTLTVE